MPCVPLSASKMPFQRSVERAGLMVENITTNDTDTLPVDVEVYETKIQTAGSESAEMISIPDGTVVGQRKLITVTAIGAAGTAVGVAFTNIVNASAVQLTGCSMDADDEFLLLEWNGSKWQVVYSAATLATD